MMFKKAMLRRKKLKAPTISILVLSSLLINIKTFISDLFDIISIEEDMGIVTAM